MRRVILFITLLNIAVMMIACGNAAVDKSSNLNNSAVEITNAVNDDIVIAVPCVALGSDDEKIKEALDTDFSGIDCSFEDNHMILLCGSKEAWEEKHASALANYDSMRETISTRENVFSKIADWKVNEDYTMLAVTLEADSMTLMEKILYSTIPSTMARINFTAGKSYDDFDVLVVIKNTSGVELSRITYSEQINARMESYLAKSANTAVDQAEEAETMIEYQSLKIGEKVGDENEGTFFITGWDSGPAVVSGGMQMITYAKGDYYIWVTINYTNYSTEPKDMFELMTKGTLVYKDKYEYDGASGSFTRDAAPLQENQAYLVFAASEVAASDPVNCIARFCIDGNYYSFHLNAN